MSDLALDRLLRVDDAIAILDALSVPRRARPPRHGRPPNLATDVTADRDYPPFDKSLVDGYAMRAADLAADDMTLPCVGEIAAGHAWTGGPIPAGACVAIMTGAPLPPELDAVVPVEETTPLDDGRQFVAFAKSARTGRSIARRGSDLKVGTLALPAGTAVGPAQVAVLAQLGKLLPAIEASTAIVDPNAIRAHVLVTGDEVVPHHAPLPTPDAIRDANGPMLVALLGALGVAATRSHVADDPAALRSAIDRASREYDLLLITGGVSMGRHDHVPPTLRGLGFDLPITKLRMKPGKPFVLGVRGNGAGIATDDAPPGRPVSPSADASALTPATIVFGLPGNPVSAFVCTLRLAARVIRRTYGEPAAGDLRDAVLALPLPANGPREFYQPATFDPAGRVVPLDWKGSADVFTLARADALIVRPIDDVARAAGTQVTVLPIP